MTERFEFITVPHSQPGQKLCAAVADGLRRPQKHLPCRFFYDEAGSELFERICELPEYYPTRTERAILERYADDIIATANTGVAGSSISLIEFGSGSSCKTRLLIEAALRQQPHLDYVPIDISGDFLRLSCLNLLNDYPDLSVTGLAAEYNDAMRALPEELPQSGQSNPRLFLFLGSNIGNFEREEATAFLARLRGCMLPQDRLLLGVDLAKDRSVLEAAYNDSAGVTAQFNKNLLRRINYELTADFDLDGFSHHAPFVNEHSRIEMHLISEREQTVTIDYLELAFNFAAGEVIHTENSHKYTNDSFAALCRPAGLSIQRAWKDPNNWFALMLLEPTTRPI